VAIGLLPDRRRESNLGRVIAGHVADEWRPSRKLGRGDRVAAGDARHPGRSADWHEKELQARFRDSLEILESDAERLARVSDPALTGAYHFWMAHLHMYNRVGDFPAAHRHADASIAAAESAGDTGTLGKLLTQKSFTAYFEGSPAEGAELGQGAAAVGPEPRSTTGMVWRIFTRR
jgi:hypothetical protein